MDHKSIEPSGEILNRPSLEEAVEVLQQDQLDAFDSLSLNGLGSAVGAGLPQAVAPTIPDLGPLINIPPTNEMVVSSSRLHEIVRNALTRALQDIIQPVVDRSVTIAAISTSQMVLKDFATEVDEVRVHTSALNMVKATAGSLALVTSKEPLRANFTNYMRNLSNDLQSGLPEGTIIMCVNSNLDLACNIIEKQAEERAIPEIEHHLEKALETRRNHRMAQPNNSFLGQSLSRWAMAIPTPYKLAVGMNGLNPEQMAIYEDFAPQPRNTTASAAAHAPSASDATRSLANEVLQEPYTTVPSLPTPAETPTIQHLAGNQVQPYPPVHSVGASALSSNGRTPAFQQLDVRGLTDRVNKLLQELLRVAGEAHEDHFMGLPRPHPVLDVVDALVQHILKTSPNSDEYAIYAAEQICNLIFQQVDDNLTLESLVHLLGTLRKILSPAMHGRVRALFSQQSGSSFLSIPLLAALIRTDLLDWGVIDIAMSKALDARKEGSLEFFGQMLDLVLLNSSPPTFYSDFVLSLPTAWAWIGEDPTTVLAQSLKKQLLGSMPPGPPPASNEIEKTAYQQDQLGYIFDEWSRLCSNQNASDKLLIMFAQQLQARQIICSREDFFLLVRIAIDMSVERFDAILHLGVTGDAYAMIDALAKLISIFASLLHADDPTTCVSFLSATFIFITLVLNHHHLKRGEHFNQRAFFRLFSVLMHDIHSLSEDMSERESREVLLLIAARLDHLGPRHLPGFFFGWICLLQHRVFMPALLQLPNNEGWKPFVTLLKHLLECLSEQMKALTVSQVTKEFYRSTFKLLVVLYHDFPDFLAGNSVRLCAAIPPHCTQLLNTVLAANPQQGYGKPPDPLHSGLKGDQMDDATVSTGLVEQATSVLRENGLLNVLEQIFQNGPTEEAVAQIAHNMTNTTPRETTYGYVVASANVESIDAIVTYIGHHAAGRAVQAGVALKVTGNEPDVATLSVLVHELPPEARYFLLGSIINQLRFPSAQTNFFSQVVLYMFGKDLEDPEETEIRQKMTRILLERLIGYWPQPWGLLSTVAELVKNEKYMFFELPFIKSIPEVGAREKSTADELFWME